MTENNRDHAVLQAICSWCEQMEEAHNQYSHSRETFISNSAYRNAVSMCLFQICENANRLSEDFRKKHPEMPWHQIRGMRNLFAHDYGNMNVSGIWETICQDVPAIENFCRKILA